MNRITAILAIVALGLGINVQTNRGASATPVGKIPTRPNILFILTDDQRWDTLLPLQGPTGPVDPMPIVNREIAAKGMTLTNDFLSIGLCCPSRTSIMRGQYAQHTGVYSNSRPYGGWPTFHAKKDDLANVATALHDAGYETGLIGKFLNHYTPGDASIVPPGWDTWNAMTRTGYYGISESVNGVETDFPKTEYQTDVLGGQAIDFISTATADDKPFFLYWAPHAPHGPATPAQRDKGSFSWMHDAGVFWRPTSYDESDISDKPPVVQAPPLTQTQVDDTDAFRELQYESLQAVDRWIGEMIHALTPEQLANTLIVFTSDNGMMWGEHRLTMMKDVGYEEAIRAPFIARWDGVIAPGTSDDHLAVNIDIAPTFAEVAGATIPYEMDGVSLIPLLTGTMTGDWRHVFLLEHSGSGGTFAPSFVGARTDAGFDPSLPHSFAYIWYFESGQEEFYDVTIDPLELNNLLRIGGQPPSLGKLALLDRLRAWVVENGYPLPPIGKGAPGHYPGPVLDQDR
jgi:N-acetylglucosamine-6-sulfatase